MLACQKGGVTMEIGQNDGGGDRGERWEYDVAHTHTHTDKSHLLQVKVHGNLGRNI